MTKFEENLIAKFPEIVDKSDPTYFSTEVRVKLAAAGLPKQDCTINNLFTDAKDPEKLRLRFCLRFCELRCLQGKEYKKRDDLTFPSLF